MNKALYISLILACAAFTRENPFFSTEESSAMPVSSNTVVHKPPLTSMTYSFPDQARVLKEATFTFQNIDGTFETRKLQIDQSIDWRHPLVLSQYGNQKAPSNTQINKSSHADSGLIQFIHSGNRITLVSKDPILRSFSLGDPSSIIIDFVHSSPFNTYEKDLSASPYSKVKVTYHGKFARAHITLDGRYTCTVAKTDQGASVICK
ncbi:MAG: AMIN domain-containing protein [Epsilonproteobacteria bacterium]|nr:AMIN domain-containing protein [Campylobacterota bacterium]